MPEYSILLIEDDRNLRTALCDVLVRHGHQVLAVETAESALASFSESTFEPDLVITDVQLPEMNGLDLLCRIRQHAPEIPVLVMTAFGTVQQAVECMRAGASDYLVKPFAADFLVARIARLFTHRTEHAGEFIAEDPSMRRIIDLATHVAPTDATVMISGESGTGKEVLARFIHRISARANGPFVAINCAAIPESMLEAVLFGHEKGAFTGALKSTPGKFEQAQGGTLLLDEISEMNINLQSKLLRILQEREVERLGGQQTIALDVRILATTNRQLRDEVSAGRFREDLYFRLNVFPLHLPPLRQRPLDILPLAGFLLSKHARASGCQVPELSSAVKAGLMAGYWEGNVRELDNVLLRALVLRNGNCIDTIGPDWHGRQFNRLVVAEVSDIPVAAAESASELSLDRSMKEQEQQMIIGVLKSEKGCRKNTAARLGISPRTLRYKLARMREQGVRVSI
jgi:two-component system response regulator FlrC